MKRRFEGEFLDGKVSGRARFTYTNGDLLEGDFRDNALVGTGRMTRGADVLLVQVVNGVMAVDGSAAAPAVADQSAAAVQPFSAAVHPICGAGPFKPAYPQPE